MEWLLGGYEECKGMKRMGCYSWLTLHHHARRGVACYYDDGGCRYSWQDHEVAEAKQDRRQRRASGKGENHAEKHSVLTNLSILTITSRGLAHQGLKTNSGNEKQASCP